MGGIFINNKNSKTNKKMNSKEILDLLEAYSKVHSSENLKEKEQLDEVSYSAKKARAGEDIGKPGKQFAKIAKEAGKRYGSEERGKKVAGAVLAKLRKEDVDVFDVVLEFLQVEGYAETLEEAEWMMVNVINEEAIGIILGEDLTGGRVDFEKWYAKNVC